MFFPILPYIIPYGWSKNYVNWWFLVSFPGLFPGWFRAKSWRPGAPLHLTSQSTAWKAFETKRPGGTLKNTFIPPGCLNQKNTIILWKENNIVISDGVVFLIKCYSLLLLCLKFEMCCSCKEHHAYHCCYCLLEYPKSTTMCLVGTLLVNFEP